MPSASEEDPLGLTLRVAARLSSELLHCITSITPRARYYSFFPWAFQDYWDNERGNPGDRGEKEGILVRERAMVLGSVLHHNGSTCKGGALGGSLKAEEFAPSLQHGQIVNLASWQHLERSQFNAAYKASLVSLGLFEIKKDDAQAKTQQDETIDEQMGLAEIRQLSARGKVIADTYARSIQATQYIETKANFKSDVPYEILKDFGSYAGLCEISRGDAQDRSAIRDSIFACDRDKIDNAHYRRRMSLLLLLQSIDMVNTIEGGPSFSGEVFADLVYYGGVSSDQDNNITIPFSVPFVLTDIAGRWAIYQYHSYLSVALQSLLVGVVRTLRGKTEGIDQRQLLDYFSEKEIGKRLAAIFKCSTVLNLFSLTPEQTLKHLGVIDQNGQFFDNSMIERQITESLVQGKGAQGEEGIGLALVLIYTLFKRYESNVRQDHKNWYQQQVPERNQYTDICLPLVLRYIQSNLGDNWKDKTNREIFDRIIRRFVFLQHQTMSYERNAGNATLFRIDGHRVIGTGIDYTNPGFGNARYGSAIQILEDLGLIYKDKDKRPHVAEEGRKWRDELLEIESRR